MIKALLTATVQLVRKALRLNENGDESESLPTNSITQYVDETETEALPVPKKDKVLFQANTVNASGPIECPNQCSTKVNQKPAENNVKTGTFKITLEYNEAALDHIERLCRFFEISQTDALARGVWLLSIARDVELNNKKLGVITTDNNGLVTDVTPINIV
jgi:hypothetical protein